MKKKVCIITLAFGDAPDGVHGKSNQALAFKILDYHIAYPEIEGSIEQWEVYEDIELFKEAFDIPHYKIAIPEGKHYIDTHDVLVAAKKLMEEHGYTEALINAHEDHQLRCLLTAKKLGIVISDLKPKIYPYIPYDMKSTQLWTKSELIFIPYDVAVKFLYWFKRYLRARDYFRWVFTFKV